MCVFRVVVVLILLNRITFVRYSNLLNKSMWTNTREIHPLWMGHTTFIVMFDHSNTKKTIGNMQSIGCPRKNEPPGISLTSWSILIRFGEAFVSSKSEETRFPRSHRFVTFRMAAFVRIVLGRSDDDERFIESVSRMLFHHHSILRRLMAPLRSRKIFVSPPPISYFESTSFWKSLLFIFVNGNNLIERDRNYSLL
jgi:hypothetical protein